MSSISDQLITGTLNGEDEAVKTEQMSATGFFIFTVVSGLMACYILYSVFGACSRYQLLRQLRQR